MDKENEKNNEDKQENKAIINGYFTYNNLSYSSDSWYKNFTGTVIFSKSNGFTFSGTCYYENPRYPNNNGTQSAFFEYDGTTDVIEILIGNMVNGRENNVTKDNRFRIRFDIYQRIVSVNILEYIQGFFIKGNLNIGI
jgi:hypothetical protein